MVISCSFSPTLTYTSPHLFFIHHPNFNIPRHRRPPRRREPINNNNNNNNNRYSLISSSIDQNPPRTLFPGGFKRPEIKLPNLLLRLTSDEVLRDDKKAVLDVVDDAVSNRVGIVLLTGGSSGKDLYEAACLLKSLVRDRAYFIIHDRVDIAAAVNATGVLLSDQGLPTIVARNTMIDAKSDSVLLPLVARNVQTYEAALDASISEGADFLILSVSGDGYPEELVTSVSERVKIPIFVLFDQLRHGKSSNLLRSGACGLVVTVGELKLLREDDLSNSLYREYESKTNSSQSSEELKTLDVENGFPRTLAGFMNLEQREKQFVEKERSFLVEAVNVIQEAAPLMGDISLLKDAVAHLDQPFLLVIVVIVC